MVELPLDPVPVLFEVLVHLPCELSLAYPEERGQEVVVAGPAYPRAHDPPEHRFGEPGRDDGGVSVNDHRRMLHSATDKQIYSPA